MSNVVTTREANGLSHFYWANVGSASFTQATLPTGVVGWNRRPSAVEYRKRLYMVGQFTTNLTFTEVQTLHTMGIAAPTVAPIIATGAAGAITGSCVGYYSFVHKTPAGATVAESNLSPASNTVVFAAQQRSWTLPIVGADARVTHYRLYAQMAGALPRFVVDIAYPNAGASDNIATLALGATPPLNAVGEVANNRGVPRYARFIELYHDRAWFGGDAENPQRVYFSEVAEPEAVGTLSYIDTRDGETVTGLRRLRDTLLVFCQRATYAIQGYTVADFVMHKISPTVGCISHFAIVNIHNRLWFPAEDGVYVYDGGFHFVMEELRSHFRDDFLANKSIYLDSIAVDDKYGQIYKLLIPKQEAPNSFYYVGHYMRLGESGQPDWTFDIRTRVDSTVGELSDGHAAQVFTGAADGYVRKENITTNSNDDSDLYAKALKIRHAHMLMGDPGKDPEEGKTFVRLWTYMQSESTAWTLRALGGDEEAWQQVNPDNAGFWWKDSVAASALGGYIPKTVHFHRPERVSGRGLTVEIVATSPLSMKYRGYGGDFGPGPATRPSTS